MTPMRPRRGDPKASPVLIAFDGSDHAKAATQQAAEHLRTPIWERIINAADRGGAGIIVIGSHGRSGARYLAIGSVATAVAQHAKQPVLICHLRGDQADGSS